MNSSEARRVHNARVVVHDELATALAEALDLFERVHGGGSVTPDEIRRLAARVERIATVAMPAGRPVLRAVVGG